MRVSPDLLAADPPYDVAEPNDDMLFINGKVFGRRDAPALSLRGRRRDSLRGRLDDWEDPDDVYWILVPGHSSFSISLKMRRGDADLFAYQSRVPTITTQSGNFRRRGLISASRRPGRRRDAVYIDNPGRATRLAVAVRIFHPVRTLDAEYTLSARRLRH